MDVYFVAENPEIRLQEGGILIEDKTRPAAEILAEQSAQDDGPALFIP